MNVAVVDPTKKKARIEHPAAHCEAFFVFAGWSDLLRKCIGDGTQGQCPGYEGDAAKQFPPHKLVPRKFKRGSNELGSINLTCLAWNSFCESF